MHVETTLARKGPPLPLVALSFVPLLVKAIGYATIGGYVPLGVFSFFGGLVAWSYHRGPKASARAVKVWAVALALWGLARLVVMALFLSTSVSEAHIESQFTAWYVLLSLGHVVLGVYLFRRAGDAP